METPVRLIVDLGRLDDGKREHLTTSLDQAVLELDDLEQIRPIGPVVCDLQCELLEDELLVRGSLAVRCACQCCRCGCDFEAVYTEEAFCETFDVAGAVTLDLTEAVREGILIALPLYPICKEACKGVCLRCGQDLNAGPCTCNTEGGSSPWDALDGLTPDA